MSNDKSEFSPLKSDLSNYQSPLIISNNSDNYLFISDLHLCAERQSITNTFLHFLKTTATKANALYILGDLFEYWSGDDDIDDDFHQQIIAAFKSLSNTGVRVYLMHGNRDFLIGEKFCTDSNITLLNDPTLIHLFGNKVLLSHGDDLCTDDISYQQFRAQVRNTVWQSAFLAQPLIVRKKQIETIRMRSEQEKTQKATQIMDVNQKAVNTLLEKYDYPDLLIHGHTHRPSQHTVNLNSHTILRWVLGDWYEQGSYLSFSESGLSNVPIPS